MICANCEQTFNPRHGLVVHKVNWQDVRHFCSLHCTANFVKKYGVKKND
jgi:hypothetical protein